MKERWGLLRSLGIGFVNSLLALFSLWAVLALYFDFPVPWLRVPASLAYALGVPGVCLKIKRRWKMWGIWVSGFGLVLAWWLTLRPSNTRPWMPDVMQTAWAERDGNRITVYNVRNCDYRSETDYTPRWETRTVYLSDIRGIDLFITFWGSPWTAHPILSFQFGDNDYLAFSIETRKEIGEEYSAIRGFFRQFELTYIIGDERDLVRLRTNYRKGEETYLYRTNTTPGRAREVLLEFLQHANRLHEKPEWYNAVTSNCTTNIRIHMIATAHGEPVPWDWRFLLSGRGDEMIYERGMLAGNLPFTELKRRAHINPAALAADKDPGFSRRIRENRPGF